MEAQPSGGEDAEPVSYKILLLGEGAVGKSSFTRRLCRPSEAQQNPNWYLPTIGVETSSVLLHTSRGQILLNLYDTSVAFLQVSLVKVHPFFVAHFNTSNWPPSAAYSQVV